MHTYIHITFDSRTISSKLQVCFSYKSKRQFFNVISGGSWTTFSLWPGWCRSFAPDANAICCSWHTESFDVFLYLSFKISIHAPLCPWKKSSLLIYIPILKKKWPLPNWRVHIPKWKKNHEKIPLCIVDFSMLVIQSREIWMHVPLL